MAQSRMRSAGSLIISLICAAGAIALLIVAPWWLLLAAVLLLSLWTVATRIGRQAWSVTEVGLATIPQRLGAAGRKHDVIVAAACHQTDPPR